MKYYILVFCLSLFLGCTKQEAAPSPAPVPEQEKPVVQPEKPKAEPDRTAEPAVQPASAKTALVYEKTEYKEKLINEMKTLLEKDGIAVTVALHSKEGIELGNPGDYGAIFLTISGVNSTVRPWVTDWLKANAALKEKIILHVTQTHAWKVDADVDTVTGASKDDTKAKAAEYAEILKKKLQ